MKPTLLLVALLLGGVLVLEWHDWSPDAALPAPPASPAPTAAGEEPADLGLEPTSLEPPPKEDYASVVERPLFLPDRRPPPDEEAEEPVAEEPMTELDGTDLTAVVITPAVVSAWVRAPGENELTRLRLGDDFAGWTVKTIAPDELVLERQGETNRLSLRDYENAPPPIPPTALPQRRQTGGGAAGRDGGQPAAQRRNVQRDEAGDEAAERQIQAGGRTTARRPSNERTNNPAPTVQPPRRPLTRRRATIAPDD